MTLSTGEQEELPPSEQAELQFIYDQLRREIRENDALSLQTLGVVITLIAVIVGFVFTFKEFENSDFLYSGLLFVLAVIITAVGLMQTIDRARSTFTIASYLRMFVEPKTQHLCWEGRIKRHREIRTREIIDITKVIGASQQNTISEKKRASLFARRWRLNLHSRLATQSLLLILLMIINYFAAVGFLWVYGWKANTNQSFIMSGLVLLGAFALVIIVNVLKIYYGSIYGTDIDERWEKVQKIEAVEEWLRSEPLKSFILYIRKVEFTHNEQGEFCAEIIFASTFEGNWPEVPDHLKDMCISFEKADTT